MRKYIVLDAPQFDFGEPKPYTRKEIVKIFAGISRNAGLRATPKTLYEISELWGVRIVTEKQYVKLQKRKSNENK